MNVVFIVPTGIGAEIGGHSGDATPAAKLIASLCDTLFIHPNVVNASDINEMTENMLYVEGSILDRFLEGQIGLEEVSCNKILVAVNGIRPEIFNAVSAARATIGADIKIVELEVPISMSASVVKGKASGEIRGALEAVEQVAQYSFDVLVVNTPIKTDEAEVREYLCKDGGTNLWGGVEAKLSQMMSEKLNRPVIHAPEEENGDVLSTLIRVVDPRKAAEMVSVCYLHCCLKGAYKAPRISLEDTAYWNTDVDFMVTPAHVFGRPHIACVKAGIEVIAVEENRTILRDKMPGSFIVVKNYLEAAGVISAKRAGVSVKSVRRPLSGTEILVDTQ